MKNYGSGIDPRKCAVYRLACIFRRQNRGVGRRSNKGISTSFFFCLRGGRVVGI